MQHGSATVPQQFPGAEFLERRLQRAQAVPEAERSPDVQAFDSVESWQLLHRVCELLPLISDGRPALRPGPAAYRQLMQAMLEVARAHYICPSRLVSNAKYQAHLQAYVAPVDQRHGLDYLRHSSSSASASGSGANASSGNSDREAVDEACRDYTPLAKVLSSFTLAKLTAFSLGRLQLSMRAFNISYSQQQQQQAVARELEQLAADVRPAQGKPLLSVQQLQYVCCKGVREVANYLLSMQVEMRGQPTSSEELVSAAQLTVVKAALDQTRELLPQLEPDNPGGWLLAASSMTPSKQYHSTAAMCLRGMSWHSRG